jgi:methionine-rich copper-binding protein CopC
MAITLSIVTNNANAVLPFQLVSAVPFDRQSVVGAPKEYALRFSQPVRPDRSSIKVFDSFGARVNDDALESDGMGLVTALRPLSPGRYTVKWQARCQCDGDVTLGETFHFTVK